jgi:hypothetical protein
MALNSSEIPSQIVHWTFMWSNGLIWQVGAEIDAWQDDWLNWVSVGAASAFLFRPIHQKILKYINITILSMRVYKHYGDMGI